MEVRLVLFKEIGSGISLNNQPDWARVANVMIRKEESQSQFFLPQVSLTSIFQKSGNLQGARDE
jgi:hypothetical protein